MNSYPDGFLRNKKSYRELASPKNVKIRLGFGRNKKRSELAASDQDQGPQNEGAKPMANDPQVPADPKVLGEDRPHVGVDVEDGGKILQP